MATRVQAQARARVPKNYARTQTHTHTQKYIILIGFPLQQSLTKAPHYYVICTLPVLLRALIDKHKFGEQPRKLVTLAEPRTPNTEHRTPCSHTGFITGKRTT